MPTTMREPELTILLIEDNPVDACILREFLAESTVQTFKMIQVSRLQEGIEQLTKFTPEAILLDLGLPDSFGLDSVRQIHGNAPHVPLIVLTGLEDHGIAVQALQHGAQDYLTKGRISSDALLRAVQFGIERHKVQGELRKLALFDELTGLHNRRGFFALAEQNLKLARRCHQSFVIVFADLDGLKAINDALGHEAGNAAIQEAAEALRDSFRQSDILCRLGGDEFVALMIDANRNSCDVIRRRLHLKVQRINSRPGREFNLSISVGTLLCGPDEARSVEEILKTADEAMYEEKKSKGVSRERAHQVVLAVAGPKSTSK